MEKKTGRFTLQAAPYHVDMTRRLSMGVLGNHLLNVAGMHAERHRFGMTTLTPLRYTWVLSRLAIELEEMPEQYAEFEISTWIESVYKLFTNRNYRICNAEGRPIGYAKSVWAMMNIDDRKPVDLLTVNEGSIVQCVCEETCPIENPGRCNMKGEIRKEVTHHTVYSDIDINGHVNSIKYIEHVLDLFEPQHFLSHRLRRFEIAYATESYYGDTLHLRLNEENPQTYYVEVKKNNEEVVVRCKIVFD